MTKDELIECAKKIPKEFKKVEQIPVEIDLKKAHLGLVGNKRRMIYWNYINKPTKHPEPVRIPETEDDKSKNLETAGEIAVGAILLWGTYEVLKWSVAALTAAPTGGASLVAAGCTP